VATSLEHVEPLELASIRDDVVERPAWTSRATVAVLLAALAVVVALLGALAAGHVPLGPGRALAVSLVVVWAATAVFVGSYFSRRTTLLRAFQMVGALLWLFYGIAIKATPVIVANVLVFSAAAWTLLRHSRGPAPQSAPR